MPILDIQILDKTYQIKCPVDKIIALQEAAKLVGEEIARLRASTDTMSLERLAIMTAINMSHSLLDLKQELLNLQKAGNQSANQIAEHLQRLQKKIEECLTLQAQMDL
jgi:cell division protein ZapA